MEVVVDAAVRCVQELGSHGLGGTGVDLFLERNGSSRCAAGAKRVPRVRRRRPPPLRAEFLQSLRFQPDEAAALPAPVSGTAGLASCRICAGAPVAGEAASTSRG